MSKQLIAARIVTLAPVDLVFPLATATVFGFGTDRDGTADVVALIYSFGLFLGFSTSVWPLSDLRGWTRFERNRVKVLSSEITNNFGHGIHADGGVKISLKDTLVSGNALNGYIQKGAFVPVKISGGSITDNGLSGIHHTEVVGGGRCTIAAKISDSTITGNGTDEAVCGVSETCSDVSSCRLPNMSSVTCDTSYDTTSGFPGTSWGICALD